MIQRIQSVYLLLAVISTVTCSCMMWGAWIFFVILILYAIFGFYTIFVYNNRKMQAKFCLFNMLLLVCWYILYFVIAHLDASGETGLSWYVSLPGVSLVLYYLARRAIISDEKLVRAADRIR